MHLHDSIKTEDPILALPSDPIIVERLKSKLDEYKDRLSEARQRNPYVPPENLAPWYAVRILETLLRNKSVNTWELSLEIANDHGGRIVKQEYFETYCGVIDDYTKTGGVNVTGGRGFGD